MGKDCLRNITALFTILEYLYAFCITDYFPWLRGKTDLDGHEKNTRKALEIVRKYQDPLVNERIQMWKSGARMENSDLLDALIKQDEPKLTPDEIKAQITVSFSLFKHAHATLYLLFSEKCHIFVLDLFTSYFAFTVHLSITCMIIDLACILCVVSNCRN